MFTKCMLSVITFRLKTSAVALYTVIKTHINEKVRLQLQGIPKRLQYTFIFFKYDMLRRFYCRCCFFSVNQFLRSILFSKFSISNFFPYDVIHFNSSSSVPSSFRLFRRGPFLYYRNCSSLYDHIILIIFLPPSSLHF